MTLIDRPSASGVRKLELPSAPLRILVVDAERDQADSLVEALQTMGHTARGEYDAASALAVAQEFAADLALLDVGLPGMNGYELAAKLEDLLGDAMPLCLAITGYDQPGDRARSAAGGFAAHLVKPLDLYKLESMLARLAPRAITPRRTGS